MRVTNAVLPGRSEPVTIVTEGGRITAIKESPGVGAPGEEVIDAAGRTVLPGLVNAHAHIDKTLHGGPWVSAPQVETVAERVAHERRHRDTHGLPSREYVASLVEAMVVAGTTHLRTHTDVDPGVGLRGITAVAEVARRYEGVIDIQQVAFPQGGLITNPGTLPLLRDAVEAGASVIGGLDPAGFDDAPNAHLEAVFDLAASTGTGIDIHLHDGGSLGAWEMGLIARMTREYDLGGRVAVSHAFGIAHPPTQAALLERFAEAGVALVSAAVYDAPVPPLRACAEHGVLLAGGTDGINDLWGPFGDGDMLRRAMLIAYRNSSRSDDELMLALDAVTTNAARVLGIEDHGLTVGGPADLVVVDARSAAEAVARVPGRDLVIRSGRVVARDGALVGAEGGNAPPH
ncbi:amidohydrolase family protein [Nocardiopsis eucommiae]|uniref:Amidohydrolase family protein n=1 Tax=Nocardiopsis eucommiae TaxID=2831970 RepID=A0A975L7P7_9ACTN|nr:amidohydrolase family protein [Nocardiopsis eucommiae]